MSDALLQPVKQMIIDALRIEDAANDVVTNARQVLHAATSDHDHRVLLQVVSLARDVRRDFHPVGQPHAGHLAQRRVRLLRRAGVDAETDAALLRAGLERRDLVPELLDFPPPGHELVHRRHRSVSSPKPPAQHPAPALPATRPREAGSVSYPPRTDCQGIFPAAVSHPGGRGPRRTRRRTSEDPLRRCVSIHGATARPPCSCPVRGARVTRDVQPLPAAAGHRGAPELRRKPARRRSPGGRPDALQPTRGTGPRAPLGVPPSGATDLAGALACGFAPPPLALRGAEQSRRRRR